MKYRSKPVAPVEVEAITFDALVDFGRHVYEIQGLPLVNGMPWSFSYAGNPVTHENDNCYLILTPATVRFERGMMLVTASDGTITAVAGSVFRDQFEPCTKAGV